VIEKKEVKKKIRVLQRNLHENTIDREKHNLVQIDIDLNEFTTKTCGFRVDKYWINSTAM